jgi:hypothetical protein
MKKTRWIYRVYLAGRFVQSFTSRAAARKFMENMTDFDLPFLLLPHEDGQTPYMIGELK